MQKDRRGPPLPKGSRWWSVSTGLFTKSNTKCTSRSAGYRFGKLRESSDDSRKAFAQFQRGRDLPTQIYIYLPRRFLPPRRRPQHEWYPRRNRPEPALSVLLPTIDLPYFGQRVLLHLFMLRILVSPEIQKDQHQEDVYCHQLRHCKSF